MIRIRSLFGGERVKRLVVPLFGLVFLLSGCSLFIDADRYKRMDIEELCETYDRASERSQVLVQVLNQRKYGSKPAIRSYFWDDVRNDKVRRGMHRCEVLATLGAPVTVNEPEWWYREGYWITFGGRTRHAEVSRIQQ